MATHSSVLAWRIPWTEEPGGLQPMGSQRDTTELLILQFHFRHTVKSEVTQSYPTLCNLMNRQGYWSGLPLPSPGYLPDPRD